MIPLIEDYLSDSIKGRLSYLKSNPQHVQKVLGANANRLENLQKWLDITDIRVLKGWPRGPGEMPCIAILLEGEEESQAGIGDIAENDEVDIREASDTLVVIDMPGGGVPFPHVRTERVAVYDIKQVVNLTTGVVLPESSYYLANEAKGLIQLTSGASEGDELRVDYYYRHVTEINMETLYESNYRIEVWTTSGELTIYLYQLVKWALLSDRDSLGKKGLFRQRMTGADFEPATSWMPDFVYRRALSFWCQQMPSVPVEEVPYIEGVFVEQTVSFEVGEG